MTTTSALRTRTQTERDAINARARAWPRPLSQAQCHALKMLGENQLVVTRAGWQAFGGYDKTSTKTLMSLAQRGLIIFFNRSGRPQRARITNKGREHLRRCA